jgi:hypothetical protein
MAYTFACLGVRQIAQSARIFSPAMNALGHSRHFDRPPTTSGLPRRTDILRVRRHVSKVPTGDSRSAAITSFSRGSGVLYMRRKNLEIYQAALKLAREERATGKAFRKSLLRIPPRA